MYYCQQENVLQDVLAVYVFGGMVIMPHSPINNELKQRTVVNCWKTHDEGQLRTALEAALPGPSDAPTDEQRDPDTERGARCYYDSFHMNPPVNIDAALITIEIWTNKFLIRAWASYESGSAKYHPILKADIPLRHGFAAIYDVVNLLLKSFS
ncbi:MAG: hypothetical protein K2X77_09405 [Candidatus Obscuribacterales bacterium]|nr:hypothetical protein [Candidatus Obscuribacterales bacterium]